VCKILKIVKQDMAVWSVERICVFKNVSSCTIQLKTIELLSIFDDVLFNMINKGNQCGKGVNTITASCFYLICFKKTTDVVVAMETIADRCYGYKV
jgi:hypothetical protein